MCSLHGGTDAHGAVAMPEVLSCPTSPAKQPQADRKVLSLVHAQRRIRKEDRKVNSDVFLGTLGSVAEPEQGLCVSSFLPSSTRPLAPREHLTLSCSPGLF